ncbi:MAG TPA: hypothetical protein VEY33_03215, partial [Gemmatimonadota bacterium]|nr:hypothetical protein [Gemmatimonadota bacterium]
FHQADSARATKLIQTYARIAPEDDEHNLLHSVAFLLAFGDSAGRSRALGALDTLPIATSIAVLYLRHPRFGRLQEQVLRRFLARSDAPPWVPWLLFVNLLNRGRFRAALEFIDNEPTSHDPSSSLYADQPLIAYLLIESGMALPPERIDRDLSVAGNLQERNAFFAGAYAADQGRWPAYDSAVRTLRAAADRLEASGDSLDSDWNESAAKVLQAYGRWKRGHGAEALPILRSLERPTGPTTWMIAWWVGELSLELGKQREAAAYFGSIWGDDATLMALAAFHLGEIYTDLGEFEKARESYEYALLAWQDADPEMRPRIEAARQALARLPKPLRRESQ